MKTIFDAVNELRASLDNLGLSAHQTEKLLWLNTNQNDYVTLKGVPQFKPEIYFKVCTIKEFNALVAAMSLGLDVNPINEGYYHKYLAADKQELEPAPIIDWDSAPDGKNYALANKDKGLVEFFREKPVFYGDNSTPCWANHENEELHLRVSWGLHERPIKQESNIYTQEMCDNGELPSVGMKCETDTGAIIEVMLPFDSTRFTVGKVNNEYGLYGLGELKPITLPTPLIDGEAYQFDYDGDGIKGIYCTSGFLCQGGFADEKECTNIKPLTVKGEQQ